MRARNIKPGFFKNESLVKCDPLARILFAGLWCLADRQGRLEDRPLKIKIEILPCDNCDVNHLLGQLHDNGLIVRYHYLGSAFIEIPKFTDHQKPHIREQESTIPQRENEKTQPRRDLGSDKPALNPESLLLNPESSSPLPPSPPESLVAKATTIKVSLAEEVPKANGYHAIEFHDRYNEVRMMIVSRLPALAKQNATEVNRWLMMGADVDSDIMPSVNNAIEFKRGNIGSFSYFTPGIESCLAAKKERIEQDQRRREKYAKSS